MKNMLRIKANLRKEGEHEIHFKVDVKIRCSL